MRLGFDFLFNKNDCFKYFLLLSNQSSNAHKLQHHPMEWFFQVLARYLLVLIIKLSASSCVMSRSVFNWKARQRYPALKVDRGVRILPRQSAEVKTTIIYWKLLLSLRLLMRTLNQILGDVIESAINVVHIHYYFLFFFFCLFFQNSRNNVSWFNITKIKEDDYWKRKVLQKTKGTVYACGQVLEIFPILYQSLFFFSSSSFLVNCYQVSFNLKEGYCARLICELDCHVAWSHGRKWEINRAMSFT